MKIRLLVILCLLPGLSYLPSALAKPPESVQTEVNYLLGFVEVSGCEFFRNGVWYDSVKAQAHLRLKYEYLAARNQIKTAEDFIDLAASKSSLTGRPYEIRCGECKEVETSPWLRGVLTRYRIVALRNAGKP